MTTTRRRFLVLSARALAVAPFVACSDDPKERPSGDTGLDTVDDTSADAGTDTGADTGTDAGVDADTLDAVDEEVSLAELAFSKGPWAMVAGATSIRLRVETREDLPLDVALIAPGGDRVEASFDRNTEAIELAWPPPPVTADFPDEAGDHTLHEILFTELEPGVRYTYEIAADGYAARSGSFRAPAAPGQAFSITWVADTMFPESKNSSVIANDSEPDLFLHGGDIQYFSNPFDTWNGYFQYFGPVLAHAAAHHAIGNHEYEEPFDEYGSHFVRLFGGQGEADDTNEYFAFTFGAVRFIFLNSEVEFGEAGTDQGVWMEAELAAAAADDDIAFTVVAFHRPIYSFGKTKPDMDKRNYLHPLFLANNVKLVLQGHNHGYERFVVDGIQYVLDAGGGAALTDIDDHLEEIAAERPEEPDLRVVKSSTYGALLMQVAEDGTLTAERHSTNDGIVDTFTVE